MTVRDFMNYLVYVEHSAENLQFYLWYLSYEKRFAETKVSDIHLAPEWTREMQEDAVTKLRKANAEKMRPEPKAAAIFKGTDFEKQEQKLQPLESVTSFPLGTPPRTLYSVTDTESTYAVSGRTSSSHVTGHASHANEAFAAAGVRVPCKWDLALMFHAGPLLIKGLKKSPSNRFGKRSTVS